MAEVGLSARTRKRGGALLERWRAQCGVTATTIQESAISRIWRALTSLFAVRFRSLRQEDRYDSDISARMTQNRERKCGRRTSSSVQQEGVREFRINDPSSRFSR